MTINLTTILELPAAAFITGSEWLPIVQGTGVDAVTRRTQTGAIASLATGGNGTETANTVLAGPTSGSAAAPTFRALVAADIPAAAISLTIGTTPISSGTSGRVLYDNAGVLGEYTISGTGTVVAMATSPVFTTPTLGVAIGTSLALGGATIGSNALAVTGGIAGSVQIWSGSLSSALTTLTGGSDGFRASSTNVTQFASESTTTSGSGGGALLGVYSNDGAAMASGDRLGGIRAGGSSSASALRNSAIIAAFAAEGWADGSAYGSRWEFQTTTNLATTATTKLIISNAGLLALGATLANTIPALKPSSAILQARLGDDSAYCAFEALTFNKVTITAPASSATLTIADGKTLTISNILTLAGTDSTVMTFPTTSASIARTDAGQTFTGASTATSWVATTFDARGVWTAGATWTLPALTLGGTVSGGGNQINNVIIGTATPLAGSFTTVAASTSVTVTSSSASALTVGLNGATNPVLQVDSSTGSQAAGLKLTGAATGGTVALAVIDSGSNANLTINAKGSGTIGIGSVSTGAVTITPALTLSAALTYGGVTLSNSVTGTGSMVLSASPSLTGTLGMASGGIISFNAGNYTLTHSSGLLTSNGRLNINLNSAAVTAAGFSPLAVFVGADGSLLNEVQIQGYSSSTTGNGLVTYFKARGTAASPTAVNSGDQLGANFAFGYATSGGAGFVTTAGAGFTMVTTEAYTSTAAGSKVLIKTTPNGSATLATAATFDQDKSLTIAPVSIPAGGTAGVGYKFSSTSNYGVFFGSGAPSLAAAKGSLYLRSDGSTTNDRAYINTDGSTTWTALTTAA